MTTLEDAWKQVKRWAQQDKFGTDRCLLDLRRRVEALEQRAATPEPVQEWIRRKVYKNSTEYSDYIKQRFQDRTSSSFEFDGHRWQYEHSSFDDTGEYDLISRPPAPEPAPAPAADRPLWEVVAQARYNSDGARMASVRLATAAEIDAVADWLAARGCAGSADLLHAEARRAREGA